MALCELVLRFNIDEDKVVEVNDAIHEIMDGNQDFIDNNILTSCMSGDDMCDSDGHVLMVVKVPELKRDDTVPLIMKTMRYMAANDTSNLVNLNVDNQNSFDRHVERITLNTMRTIGGPNEIDLDLFIDKDDLNNPNILIKGYLINDVFYMDEDETEICMISSTLLYFDEISSDVYTYNPDTCEFILFTPDPDDEYSERLYYQNGFFIDGKFYQDENKEHECVADTYTIYYDKYSGYEFIYDSGYDCSTNDLVWIFKMSTASSIVYNNRHMQKVTSDDYECSCGCNNERVDLINNVIDNVYFNNDKHVDMIDEDDCLGGCASQGKCCKDCDEFTSEDNYCQSKCFGCDYGIIHTDTSDENQIDINKEE